MKRVLNVGLLAGVICFLGALMPAAFAAPLTLPFTNLVSYTTNQMTNFAASASPISAMTSTGSRYYRGAFSASSASTRLAIQSDDGSDVYVNKVKIISKKGAGTHWPTLSGSLDILDYTFATGIEYCIEIDYLNNAYTPGDTDGVSLYAFNGGGSVRDGIAVWGPEMICSGGIITLEACGDASFSWSSSAPSVASISGSGSSVTINGLAPGSATITATDGNGKSGSRTVKVVRLWIEPSFYAICDGVANTLILTNTDITSGIIWSVGSATTRTNTVALSVGGNIGSAGTNYITATWSGCSATATAIVVQAASLTANTNHLCGSGQVIYNAQSTPAGYEGNLTWSGEGLSGGGNSRTNSYSTPGVKTVTVSCGTSVKSNTVTVHKVDITNSTEYALAGGSAVPYYLSSDSVGPFTWSVTPSGPSVNGSGSAVTISPGSAPGAYTVTAAATPLSSCSDTATLQVVEVTFPYAPVAFCYQTSTNLTFTVNPSSALSLLAFDTVTNVSGGPVNTHCTLYVIGNTVSVYGGVPGNAWLRVKLGNSVLIGPSLQIVRVTFPTNDWYVGVGKSLTNTVTIIPTNATVTFDTASSAIATAEAVAGGVKLTGVAPGTTQVRAKVGDGAVCANKDVTAVRVKFATNTLTVCNGNPFTIAAAVDPPGSPVTFTPSSSNLLQVTVTGTNVTVSARTNGAATVNAMVGTATMDDLLVWSLTVRFPSNDWYVAPGGHQPFTVFVDPPKFAKLVGFMSSNTSIITVTAGAAPPNIIVHGATNGSAFVKATVNGTNDSCVSKLVTVTTPTIASVQWMNLDGSPITNTNPNPGGGLKYFPDSPLPGAPPANQVRIRATVTPAVNWPNAVHFRVFDVDDPSSTNAVLDNESSVTDNKGSHTPPATSAVTADTNGIAEVVMTLSMNPGDNFRAVAATDAAFFTGMAARQSDTSGSVTNLAGNPVAGNQITPVLTIWRALNVEKDSMKAVPAGSNRISGNFSNFVGSGGTSVSEISGLSIGLADGSIDLDSVSPGNGRFESGRLLLGNFGTTVVISNVTANGDRRIVFPTNAIVPINFHAVDNDFFGSDTLDGTVTQITQSGGSFAFRLNITLSSATPIDWDDFVGGKVSVGGGPTIGITSVNTNLPSVVCNSMSIPFVVWDDDDLTLLPQLPDLSILVPALADAYIEVRDNGGGNLANNQTNCPFVLNVPSSSGTFRRQAVGTDNYWVAYVLSGYQYASTSDWDPNGPAEGGTGGATPPVGVNPFSNTGVVGTGGRGSIVLRETIRDRLVSGQLSGLEPRVVAHEVGHQMGLDHWDTGEVGVPSTPVPVNLMLRTVGDVSNSQARFVPDHLHLLRTRVRSPGQ